MMQPIRMRTAIEMRLFTSVKASSSSHVLVLKVPIVSYPIRKSPDSGFFTCDSTNKCILPSSRERHKGLKGRGHDLRLLCQ